MAQTIDELLVSLGLKMDSKSFQKGQDAIKGVSDKILQLAAVAGAGMGFRALTSGVAQTALEMKRVADNTGFTIRQVQGLEMAMRRLRASPEAAQDIAKMIPSLQLKARYGQLGDKAYWGAAFNPTEFSNMDKMQALQYLVNSYGKMNYDQRNFLREGIGVGQDSPITRLMEKGGGFLNESMSMADKMPYPIDEELLKNSQKFNDEMAQLENNFQALTISLGKNLIPMVNSFLEVINKFIQENPEIAKGMLTAAGVGSTVIGAGVLNKFLSKPKGPAPTTGGGGGMLSGAVGLLGAYVTTAAGVEVYDRSKAALNGDQYGGFMGNGAEMSELERLKRKNAEVNARNSNSEIGKLVDNPNARAYLDAIAKAEGTAGHMNGGYNTLFGGEQFANMSDHPRILKPFTQTDGVQNKTSAAGRYQFTQKSWDEAASALGLTDFSPRSQDMAALWLIQRAGQLDNVVNGDFMSATNGLGGVWASLPSSPYAQPKRSQADMANYLGDYGYRAGAAPTPAALPVIGQGGSAGGGMVVNQQNEFNISGAGLNEQQMKDAAAAAIGETAKRWQQSYAPGG
ncbi:glycoside hydrolase family protein [Dickeya undicola]|uniref:Lysozyme n=1 Tax=Dickeya undicola TaxID=1577887 RepID=A0A3N0G5K5_9GAMM|nr:glycoside hydrolase family protein [Dickeya undicola]RNM07699.1 lysozyme [Dickeya undicola]